MRKNTAARRLIVDCVTHYGGIVSLDQIRLEAKRIGMKLGDERLDRYAAELVEEGVLRRISNGRYAHASTMLNGSLGDFARIPYGDCLYGRILHFMLRRRYVTASQVHKALRKWNPALARDQVYHALHYLKRKEYIDTVATNTYTLAKRTLDAIGVEDVLDAPGPYVGPITAQLVPHVREFLSALPPKTDTAIQAHLTSLGFQFEKPDMFRAIYRLSARKVARACYTLVPDTEGRAETVA